MIWIWLAIYTLIGIAAMIYAFYSDRVKFTLADHLPEVLANRKMLFTAGLAIVLIGFGAAYALGVHHALITLFGGWIMLLGSAPWFNQRIVRRLFAPPERRIIRTTIFTGFVIAVLSSGRFYFPPQCSPSAFLLGLAIMILAGRLWWNGDTEGDLSSLGL
ncbi:MAG: hypothetical protein AB1656_23495 [Candidatus Omnitrophota bacterium]